MEKEEKIVEPDTKDTEEKKITLDLKTSRESLGMSLDEISRVTRIGPDALEAIEKEEFNLLPEPVYARSFIKTYAETVGMDGEEILSRYNSYLEKEGSFEGLKDYKKRSWLRSHLSIIIWGVVFFSVIFFFVFSYLYKDYEGVREGKEGQGIEQSVSNLDEGKSPVTEGMKEEVSPEKEPVAFTPPPETDVVADPEDDNRGGAISGIPEDGREVIRENVSEEPYTLEIEATEWTWLEIRMDDGNPFEILLKPGERIVREAMNKFSLIVGNAGGVHIVFDEKPLGRLGKHGEVILLTLPKDAGN
jgi:cytoskeleton protein RodZ